MPNEPKDEPSLLVTRAHGLRIKKLDESARTAEFVASTDAIDSYDEIVEQSWDLSRFRDNPIILYGHDRWGLPIGKATKCEVVADIGGPRLECTIEFATTAMNPLAEQVWQLVQAGMLRAVSVGFRPRNVKYEKRNGKDIYVLSDNLLLEISVVTIPANPEALAKADAALIQAKQKAFTVATGREPVFDGNGRVVAGWTRSADPTPITVPAVATSTQEKTNMSEKELQAALDKAKADHALAEEKIAARDKRIEEVQAVARAADADAKEAKKRAEDAANTALQADARAKAAEERAAGLEASNAGLTETVSKTLAALGGSKKKIGADGKETDELESLVDVAVRTAHEMIVREVDALVDTKLLPAEKEDFVELAKTNRPLFERMIAQRAEHGLLKPVVKGAKVEPSSADGASDNGEDFAKAVDAATETAGAGASGGDFGDAVNDAG